MRDEPALEALRVPRRILGDPFLDGDRVHAAVGGCDLDADRHGGAVVRRAHPDRLGVVLVVARVDVRVAVDADVDDVADAGARRVIDLGRDGRADVGVGARARVAGAFGVRLDREPTAPGVLVVVGALGVDVAIDQALALGLDPDAVERVGGGLDLGERLVALGADPIDVVLVVDDTHVRVPVRADQRELGVGHPRADDDAGAAAALDGVVHVQAQRLEIVIGRGVGQFELHQRRVVLARERRCRYQHHRRRDRGSSHPWPHVPLPLIGLEPSRGRF